MKKTGECVAQPEQMEGEGERLMYFLWDEEKVQLS